MQEFHFPTWVNKFTVLVIMTGLTVGGYLATCLFAGTHPRIINLGHQPKQPVPFSHALHAGQLGLDCRYCHNTVEVAGHAAVPATATCGNCHGGNLTTGEATGKPGRDIGIVHPTSTLLKPVRDSLEKGDALMWKKVHDLPDFVYFNHSVHINKGVSCVSCHGRIDQMEVVEQKEPMSMKWCLDCHRNPTPHIRDPEMVTNLAFVPENPEQYHKEWADELKVKPDTSCSVCHR